MTVSTEEVQTRLPELLSRLQPGEALVVDQDGTPVATITRAERRSWPCSPGSARDLPHWMSSDFDAPLEDFAEYLE